MLLVFCFHFGGEGWARQSGWLGVYAFFALSGFLIAMHTRSTFAWARILMHDGLAVVIALALFPYAMYRVQYLAAQAFVLALAAADLLYRGFEQPLTRWGHRWARAAKHQAVPEPAASRWRPLS